VNAHELKALQVQISKAKADAEIKKENLKVANQEYNQILEKIKNLETRLKEASTEPLVTEHALLRYIERVYGIDLDVIKGDILTENTIQAIKTLGSGKYPIGSGLKAVVKGGNVVSVVD
jgi:hypothetical protein